MKNLKTWKARKNRKSDVNFLLLLAFLSFFTACDFSSQMHKEILLAQENISQQEYALAVFRYENVLKMHPPKKVMEKIYFQLGDLYSIHRGDFPSALENYSKLREVTDDTNWQVKATEKMGEINYLYLKNYQESEKNYQDLVEFSPTLEKHDFYEYRLGLSYLELNKREQILEVFGKMISNPQHEYHGDAYYHLGLFYFQNKDFPKAVQFWSNYIKKEKKKDKIVQAKFEMGNAYESMEYLQEAYELYHSILGEYPNTEVIKNRLKSLYARRIARKR